jgi:hypothetical protein
MALTERALRAANWRQVYRYTGAVVSFITYDCPEWPGLSITKDMRGAKVVKTTYTIGGSKTDSPAQAVRYYNAETKRQSGGHEAPGSVEQIKSRRGTEGL